MTLRITASQIAGAALTTLTATGALAHAVPDVEVAKTTLNQTTLNQSAPALVGLGGAAAPPVTPAMQVATGPMDFMGTMSRGNTLNQHLHQPLVQLRSGFPAARLVRAAGLAAAGMRLADPSAGRMLHS